MAFEVAIHNKALSLPNELDAWLASIKTKVGRSILENLNVDTEGLDHYIECAEIKELPGTFICCSFYQQDVNDALTRAGIFMGAGKGMKAGTVVKHSDFPLINYKKLVAGHNLPGAIVTDFFAEIESATDKQLKPNAAEQAFLNHFIKSKQIDALNGQFYLIGISIQTTKDQKGVISHEIFHAYHFLNPKYRDTVLRFWRDHVSAGDKTAITKEVGLAYNTEDENLVVDEFQAYLVQNNAEKDRMKAFVTKYRNPLLNELQKQNIELIQI
jgi:hypothetical protein